MKTGCRCRSSPFFSRSLLKSFTEISIVPDEEPVNPLFYGVFESHE